MTTFNDAMFQVLQRQADNLGRIKTGLVVTPLGTKEQTLIGPDVDIIRLYDIPMRFMEQAYADATTILTLFPLTDTQVSRAINRIDRVMKYQIQCYTRLRDAEIEFDKAEVGAKNRLAKKASDLVSDVRWIFYDNDHLQPVDEDGVVDRADTGLVDDASVEVSYVPDIEYPGALLVFEVVCQWSSDCC